MTPEETLLAAAADISEHGLYKECYFENAMEWQTSASCALGALARAGGTVDQMTSGFGHVDNRVLSSDATRLLAKQIEQEFPDNLTWTPGDPFDVIACYNDLDSTTSEDVILMMKKAAHG